MFAAFNKGVAVAVRVCWARDPAEVFPFPVRLLDWLWFDTRVNVTVLVFVLVRNGGFVRMLCSRSERVPVRRLGDDIFVWGRDIFN